MSSHKVCNSRGGGGEENGGKFLVPPFPYTLTERLGSVEVRDSKKFDTKVRLSKFNNFCGEIEFGLIFLLGYPLMFGNNFLETK